MSPNDLAVIQQARRILARQVRRGRKLCSPHDVRDYLLFRLAQYEREVFGVFLLDNQHRVLAFKELFQGTLSQTVVYPREIIKVTIQHNAAALILVHNHPSNEASPSNADKQITQKIKLAMELMDVRVLDHFIVAGEQTVSMAELGLV
ncbi:DNA repair protein RadC [Salmonella enterica]|nr:DNA repair protein RadC [Salmonella enterica]EDW0581182.1 DNA repair protein RadC [Salmonella enterica subsp. enterica serovar Poona]EBD0565440.1 DNA repair protein RadC [Salmonella enterica]EBD1341632.1 DNA repair protein RadC [Salmonella enterica]EBI2536812.1 DNA repair protein RadC [Salmonella enterica]